MEQEKEKNKEEDKKEEALKDLHPPLINRWRLIQQVFHRFEWRIHAGGGAAALHRSARKVTPGWRLGAAPTKTVPHFENTQREESRERESRTGLKSDTQKN